MRTRSFLAIPAVVLGLVALTACSSSDGTDSAATPSAAATTAATTDFSPIPETPGSNPATKDSLDFGTLAGITTANGVVTLHVDRANFYEGDDVVAQGGDETRAWLVKDTDGEGKELTFTLDPKASIQAEGYLSADHEGGTGERETLTQKELLANFDYLTAKNDKNSDDATDVYVWLRHTDGADGPVAAIVDQFTP